MQIRLDKSNAAAVRKEAEAHRRAFKRKCSFADVVNRMLLLAFQQKQLHVTAAKSKLVAEPLVQNAKIVFGWDNPK